MFQISLNELFYFDFDNYCYQNSMNNYFPEFYVVFKLVA